MILGRLNIPLRGSLTSFAGIRCGYLLTLDLMAAHSYNCTDCRSRLSQGMQLAREAVPLLARLQLDYVKS